MPTLPAPPSFVPGAVDSPIKTVADVRELFPAGAKGKPEDAPIREAIAEAITATQIAHQQRAEYAAAQSDVTRATGLYLDGQLSDRGRPRQADEQGDDEAYRARGLAVPRIVSPSAILAAANAVLARYTTIQAKLFHSILDRWFVGTGARPYAFPTSAGGGSIEPEYADREYQGARRQYAPGGAWAFRDTAPGRLFVLRVPVLFGLAGTYVYSGAIDETGSGPPKGAFIGTGEGPPGFVPISAFFSNGAQPALDIYQTIANAVAGIAGHGVRFILIADPKLVD